MLLTLFNILLTWFNMLLNSVDEALLKIKLDENYTKMLH